MEDFPRHSQHMDETETIVFDDCKTGLGIKIIGGKSDEDGGQDYGIFVHRIIPRGLAEQSGRLKEGDQILSVNGQSLLRVTNDEAVQHLRNASATNQVTLVITRDTSSAHRFSSLLESQLAATRNTFNKDSRSVSSDHGSESPEQAAWPPLSQAGRVSTRSLSASLQSFTPVAGELGPGVDGHRLSNVCEIHLNKLSGLGLAISGGSDQPDGLGVFIQGIQPDGDCYRDGRLRVGDQLVSVNGESLSGATKDTAVEILTRASCRTDMDTVHITYIPASPSHNNHTPSSTHPSPSQANHLSSPHRHPSPHLTSPSQQQNTGNQQESLYSKPNGLSPHSSGEIAPPREEGPQSLRVGHSVSPPLYEHATALRHQIQPNIAMPLHLQRHLHIYPASSSTPQQTNGTNGHSNKTPVPYSTQFELSPVLPINSITTPTHNHILDSATPSVGVSPASPSPSKSSSRSRRLSLDPHVRLRIDRLEVALKYLGIEPTEDERQELRRRLRVDQSGTVPYGEFVAVARQIFKMQLDDSRMGAGSLTFAAHDVTDFAQPPPFNQQTQLTTPISPPVSELNRIRRERDEALREVERLKAQLLEKDRSFNLAEEELLRIRKEAQGTIHESRALKSRVHLAEAAQREARNIEIDYEEVVHMLEAEITILRRKTAKSPPLNKTDQGEVEELCKRLSVMSCELKKAEISRRTQKVATEKLLQFAELVHEYHSNGPSLTGRPRGRGESARRGDAGSLPPGYLANHSKPGPLSLAAEAKETVKAVKKLLEVEPLPYGWEEAYTAEGRKYYINHVTRSTSWLHPVSGVNHLPADNVNHGNIPETRT